MSDGVKIKGKQFTDGHGGKVTEYTQDFGSGDNSVAGQPADRNCPKGQHWDEGQGKCVPDDWRRRPHPGPRVIVDGKEQHW
jgi:hypothetical protein